MGRPSKLTPDQWAEIERKLNEGESASALAREYGISQPVISNRFSKVSNNIKSVAAIIAKGQDELAALPVVQQYQALSLAEKMRSISANLRTSSNIEQIVVEHSPSLFDFAAEVHHNIIEMHKTINKPVRRNDLWAAVLGVEKDEIKINTNAGL